MIVGQVGGREKGAGYVCMTKFCISNATSQKTCIDTCISYEQHINKIPAATAASGQTHKYYDYFFQFFSLSLRCIPCQIELPKRA